MAQIPDLQDSALVIARRILGSYLCFPDAAGVVQRWMIHEVEAYTGPEDKACHAHKGLTARTATMFGPAGHWYVYLCYGMHWMLNLVTGPEGFPAAVLIRGAGPATGPGRLTRMAGIDRRLNGQVAVPGTADSGLIGLELWIEWAEPVAEARVLRTARIGVAYAGPDWAGRPYRFLLSDR